MIDFCDKYKKSIDLEHELDITKETIRDNWKSLENKDFSSIWFTSFLTYYLLNAGINALDYLDYIPENYFYGLNITDFIVPTNIKEIGSYAFCRCYELKSVYIPDSVTKIGYNAFLNCKSLNCVRLPKMINVDINDLFGGIPAFDTGNMFIYND